MQVKHMNRRQMLTGTGLRLGRALESTAVETAPATSTHKVAAAPLVAGPADTAFDSYLGKYFPGSEHAMLHGVRPISAIVVHAGGTPIKALALRWTVETTSGVHSEVIFHTMPAHMSKDGVKSVGVARRKLIAKRHAVLLTPVTVVTSRAYARGYRPNLAKNHQTNLRRNFYGMLASKVPSSAVTVSVEGVYYTDGTVTGTHGKALHRHVRLIQNAEHDQALSVIRPLKEAETNEIPKKLSRRRFKKLSHTGSVTKRDYQHARKQHARRFVKLLRRHGKSAMVQHLTKLLQYPKIHPAAEKKPAA